MRISEIEVTKVLVHCKHCEGELKHVASYDNGMHIHVCETCGSERSLDKVYPFYKEGEE